MSLPSDVEGEGSIPGGEAKIAHALQQKKKKKKNKLKTQNRSNIITNSIKTLKMIQIEKKKKKRRKTLARNSRYHRVNKDVKCIVWNEELRRRWRN